MNRISLIISRYLLTAVVPYFAFAWLILSVILFVQQAGRYSDIFFSVNIPANLAWQLTIALIPNVVAFTCPMAILVGTIIGLTKMQGDSELVAIHAAGVGNWQIAIPIILLGVLLSAFAFFVNVKGVPLAATLVRTVALETAIAKLESPIEPGVFNTELAGFTIYVKGGDIETGRWKNIFIYSEDKDKKALRLITSSSGRIDTSGEASELVLKNATVSTLPTEPGKTSYVSENIAEVRFAIKTKRSDLLNKLTNSELTPEELGLQQLSEYAAGKEGSERVEAEILWQRRILLSVTPLIFCLLGTVIVLRFNRGGRGFATLAALIVLVGFYLLAFLGEQVARVGALDVRLSSFIPLAGCGLIILWFSLSKRANLFGRISDAIGRGVLKLRDIKPERLDRRNMFVDLTTGLRNFDLVRDLVRHFVLTLAFLTSIFVIFTAFDLWKFAAAIDGGIWLLGKYLVYLLPFVYLQIAPAAAMIAILATYVIKSRQNEIVTWISAGQSVYRLLAPSFMLALLLGGANWLVQEYALPNANRLQDELRIVIRNRGVIKTDAARNWIASDHRIYSFKCASDNEKRGGCSSGVVGDTNVFEFGDMGLNLRSVYRSPAAVWEQGVVRLTGGVEKSWIEAGRISTEVLDDVSLAESYNPLAKLRAKPSHLASRDLKRRAAEADSEIENRNLTVGLQKKQTTVFLPFVLALFTAPFSLNLSRKGKAASVGFAVALWLLFMGTTSVFEQFGLNGSLSPAAAVWFPLGLFSLIGVFLLSRVRT